MQRAPVVEVRNAKGANMRTLEELCRLRCLEHIFAFFDLWQDPHVIAEHREAIMRIWAVDVAEIDRGLPAAPESVRLALYADALQRAHDFCARDQVRSWPRFRVIRGGLASAEDGLAR